MSQSCCHQYLTGNSPLNVQSDSSSTNFVRFNLFEHLIITRITIVTLLSLISSIYSSRYVTSDISCIPYYEWQLSLHLTLQLALLNLLLLTLSHYALLKERFIWDDNKCVFNRIFFSSSFSSLSFAPFPLNS